MIEESKRVSLLVLNNFSNDSRVLKESRSLTKFGYEVLVLALHDKGQLENEIIENIPVHRIKLITRGWPKIKPIQLVKYLEFVIRVIRSYRKTDIFHCNDLNTLPIGVLVKNLFNKNCKIIYDAHEFETERCGLYGIEKKLHQWLERFLIYYSDKVITASFSYADQYQLLYNMPKPYVVLNCPPFTEVVKHDLFRTELGIRQNQTILLYQGALSPGRGIELLLEAFSNLVSDETVIVFMGYGILETEIRKQAESNSIIFFRQAVPVDILLNYTASADYGISLIEDVCLSYRYCLPNKMFEYLMAGIPVLCSNLFEMRRLVDQYNLGVVASENTVDGFLDAIKKLLLADYDLLAANVSDVKKIFNWENQEKVLLRVYGDL